MFGFGCSLGHGKATAKSCVWYESLVNREDWQPIWGPKNIGDVYDFGTCKECFEAAIDCKNKKNAKCLLSVCDGGFDVAPDPLTNKNRDNLQELYCGRLAVSQWLIGLGVLESGGNLFASCSTLSAT